MRLSTYVVSKITVNQNAVSEQKFDLKNLFN